MIHKFDIYSAQRMIFLDEIKLDLKRAENKIVLNLKLNLKYDFNVKHK